MASAGPSLGMEFFGLRRNTDGMNGLFIIGRAVVCSGLGFLMVLRVVFFSHLPTRRLSRESCRGTAWCSIDGIACPQILLAIAGSGSLFCFARLYVKCLHHGDCIGGFRPAL
jgi:hypothetical protein